MICALLMLTLGLASHQGDIRDALHLAHGDVATSDGGWLVADCAAPHDPCGDDSAMDADGHHHHGGDSSIAAAAAPTSAPLAAPVRVAALKTEQAAQLPPADAEPLRLGHVPRARFV